MTDYYDEAEDEVFEASPYVDIATEQLLFQLRDLIEGAPKVPLSASAMVSREEVLGLLDEAVEQLPDELRAARWLLKERDEFLTKVRHEGEEIINQARTQAEQMVQRTEVIKAAEQRAYEIVDQAETDARRLRHEVEDFCDQKLASFEIVLDRTMALVASGREKLQGTNLTAGIPVDELDDQTEGYDGGADHGDHADGDEAGGYAHDDSGPVGYGDDDTQSYGHLPPPPDDDATYR
jgi:vacuolar-type H+-ATPase subunit H